MTAAVHVPSKPRAGEELRNSILVAVTCLVLVGLGWLLMSNVAARATTFTGLDGVLTVDYPAGWVTGTVSEPGALLEAYAVKALSAYPPTFRVQSSAIREGQTLFDAATSLSMRRNRSLREYTELSSQQDTLNGWPAIRVSYGFVADPAAGAGGVSLPAVVSATDVLVIHAGQLLVFTTESEAGSVERYRGTFDRILRSARLK